MLFILRTARDSPYSFFVNFSAQHRKLLHLHNLKQSVSNASHVVSNASHVFNLKHLKARNIETKVFVGMHCTCKWLPICIINKFMLLEVLLSDPSWFLISSYHSPSTIAIWKLSYLYLVCGSFGCLGVKRWTTWIAMSIV